MASDPRSTDVVKTVPAVNGTNAAPVPLRLGLSPVARTVGTRPNAFGNVAVTRAGQLAGRTATFGRGLGTALRGRSVPSSFPRGLPQVRFPEGVWAMAETQTELPSNIDPAMLALQAQMRKRKPVTVAVKLPPPRRGLPSTMRRHGRSGAGPGTGPSSVLRRLAPADTFIPKNDGHFSSTVKPPRALLPAQQEALRRKDGRPEPSTGWTSSPRSVPKVRAAVPTVGRNERATTERRSGRATSGLQPAARGDRSDRDSSDRAHPGQPARPPHYRPAPTRSRPNGSLAAIRQPIASLKAGPVRHGSPDRANRPSGTETLQPVSTQAVVPARRVSAGSPTGADGKHQVRRPSQTPGRTHHVQRTSRSRTRPIQPTIRRQQAWSLRSTTATDALGRTGSVVAARARMHARPRIVPTLAGFQVSTSFSNGHAGRGSSGHTMLRSLRRLPIGPGSMPPVAPKPPVAPAGSAAAWTARLQAAWSGAASAVSPSVMIPVGAWAIARPEEPTAEPLRRSMQGPGTALPSPNIARHTRQTQPSPIRAGVSSHAATQTRTSLGQGGAAGAVRPRSTTSGWFRAADRPVPFGTTHDSPRVGGRSALGLDRIGRHHASITTEFGVRRLARALPAGRTSGAGFKGASTPAGAAPAGAGSVAASAWAARLQAAFGAPDGVAAVGVPQAMALSAQTRPTMLRREVNGTALASNSHATMDGRSEIGDSRSASSSTRPARDDRRSFSRADQGRFGSRWTPAASRAWVSTGDAAVFSTAGADARSLHGVQRTSVPDTGFGRTNAGWNHDTSSGPAGVPVGWSGLPWAFTRTTSVAAQTSARSAAVRPVGLASDAGAQGPISTTNGATPSPVVIHRSTAGRQPVAQTDVTSGHSANRPPQRRSDGHASPRRSGRERREAAMDVLRRSPSLRPKALPTSYRALASSMTAAPILVAHDRTAQAALAAAGVQAATIGRTILLGHAPTTGWRDRELVAHEMVHAAANTKTPRFFDDPHQDHEERTAASVGRLVRAMGTEVVRTPSVPPLTMGPGTPVPKLGASPAASAFAGPITPSVTGTGLATPAVDPKPQIRRTTGGRSMTTLQRSVVQGSGPSSSTSRGATSRTIQRSETECASTGGVSPATSAQADQAKTATAFDRSGLTPPSATERLDQIDELVALIEARVLAELERRGGQHRGWI